MSNSCLEEVTEAAKWWTNHLPPSVGAVLAERFQKELIRLLQHKYEGHWHPKDRRLGSAYRTVSYDHRIDPVLLHAADTGGIKNVERLLENRRFIMFVNPGEVKVKNVSNADTFWDAEVETIWRGKQSEEKTEPSVTSPQSSNGGVASNGSGSPNEATTSPTLSPEPSPPGSPKHVPNGVNKQRVVVGGSKLQAGAAPFVPSPSPPPDGKAGSHAPQGSPTNAGGLPGGQQQVTVLPRPANAARPAPGQISVQLVRNTS